jgi:membrane protein DedA with SNARE-associated domain
VSHHLEAVRPLIDRYGDFAVFAAIFVEGIGIPAPGQTLLIAGAVLAARGELSFVGLVLVAFLGATSGTIAGFAVGRYGGQRVLARFASASRLESLDRAFARFGASVVLLGRFVDGARQLHAIAAGALGMTPRRFLPWTIAGAALWTGFWGGGVYWLQRHFAEIDRLYRRIGPFAAIAIIALAAIVLVWLLRGRKASAPGA